MPSYTDNGIVLKRLNLGEADKLITLYSLIHGKVTLKAKGIRKLTSKRAGALELFNHVKFHAVRGRGDLDTLTEVILIDSYAAWRGQLGRVNLAYQMAEAVDKLTPDRQPHPKIFEILQKSFMEIGYLKLDWKLKIENWKLEMLEELGFWPKGHKPDSGVDKLIEETISRPYHSPKLLNKLK